MLRMVALLALVASAYGLPGAPSASAEGLSVLLVTGESVDVSTLELRGDELRVTAPGLERVIPLEEVIAVVGAAGEAPPSSLVETDCTVSLRDGGVLNGSLLPGEDDYVRVRVRGLGDLTLPIERVRAVAIGPPSDRSDPSRWKPRGDQDVMFRRAGGTGGDTIAGTVLRVGEDGIAIESDDLGELSLAVSDVLGVVIAELESGPKGAEDPVEIELGSGSRILGRLDGLTTGSAQLTTLFAAKIEVRMDAIRRIRFQSSLFEWLSDQEPTVLEQTPFIGGPEDFLFGWRRDRSVTGEPLQVAGHRFGKGLGMHSRSRLAFSIDGSFARLRARVGVSDEVLRHNLKGSLIVRIRVDGEVRFESGPLRAGEDAVPVDIELDGAKQLVVEVDFGDLGDIGDRAVIGDPMLLDS